MIDQQTLETLEYPKIIALIEGSCLTPYGRDRVAEFAPYFDAEPIRKRQTEVEQMLDIVRFGLPFPLYRSEDCRLLLDRARVEGSFLDPKEILEILELMELSAGLQRYDRDGRPKFPLIAEYLDNLRVFPQTQNDIKRAINEKGEIRDDASPKLKQTRSELGDTRRRILTRLDQVLSGQTKQPGWQDDVVTQRNGRYVIPVPANNYRTDIGILHDRSQSGATLFVEPKETVELNNRINLLLQEERQEMDRILRALTRQIAEHAEELESNISIIGHLDSFHAAASFAQKTAAFRPRLSEQPSLALVNARHPLLILQAGSVDKVVPLSLTIDDSRQAIVITGPNTGGKTVALKTVGLLVLMAQSGLPIPADATSVIGIFKRLFADIGDEQSIELSLSTFSSHITHIIKALTHVSSDALILLDEIGAGTDPKEGAALAEAILIYLVESGGRVIATTHYSQLKTLPLQNPAIENASLEFDRTTLAPTFRLKLGLPGSSYAVEIASRLGMPEPICTRAATLLGPEERSMSELISSLEGELKKLKEDNAELAQRLLRAREHEEQLAAKNEQFDADIVKARQEALEETSRLLDTTRAETERLVAEIRDTRASQSSVKAIHAALKTAKSATEELSHKYDSTRAQSIDAIKFLKGDNVRVVTLNAEGQIDKLIGRDRARVRIGNVTTTAELRNLRHVDTTSLPTRPRPLSRTPDESGLSPEIHLRGMTAEEAIEALEQFLDRAVVAGLRQVYVIHGKGTGTLRRRLTEYLKKHPEVASLELGNWNEGGTGVTIVQLKE